jgi:hypothetical protein
VLTASIVLDLATEPEEEAHDRRAVARACLDRAPDGTRVIILVGSRLPVLDLWSLATLREKAGRLQLDIRGTDAQTINAWHKMISKDGLGVVA